jgi:hypothetical protein
MTIRSVKAAEAAVVRQAMLLCKAGRGFCFRDDGKISDADIGKRLERACARLAALREKKGKR